MTNFEKYRDEILKINKTEMVAVDEEKNTPVRCSIYPCCDCIFKDGVCTQEFIKWLYSEHQEPAPKLTKTERAFCEVMEYGCIARNKNGNLLFYIGYPHKSGCTWESIHNYVYINSDLFKFITWEDEKPWKVKDLLKLEVEE